MIAEGNPAPDFTLPDQDGRLISLSALRGKPVVIYFYPRDDTPGCTKEACAFRDAIGAYTKAGAVILGVSPDGVASHRRFADKFGLPFPLLADEGAAVCRDYGVWKEKNMYGRKFMGVERTTVLVDGEGTVRKVFPKVRVDGHSEAVLAALKGLG